MNIWNKLARVACVPLGTVRRNARRFCWPKADSPSHGNLIGRIAKGAHLLADDVSADNFRGAHAQLAGHVSNPELGAKMASGFI